MWLGFQRLSEVTGAAFLGDVTARHVGTTEGTTSMGMGFWNSAVIL